MNYEKVLKDNERLIWKVASHFYGVEASDLFQAGVVGLLKALKNYKESGQTKFSTYAYDYIFGEMYNLANNKNLKISKDILKLYRKIEETRYILAQKLAKIPSNYEIAQFLGISLKEIELAINSGNIILSLDNESENERSAYEKISSNNDDYDTKIMLNDSLEVLNSCEKEIIKSRYFEDLTQSEVARKLKMTQVMVSRYEKKGINKMREYLTN